MVDTMSQDCSPDTDDAAVVPPAPAEQGTVQGGEQVAGQGAERGAAGTTAETAAPVNGTTPGAGVGSTPAAAFLDAIFAPDELVLIRPVEVWEEDGTKRNDVKHKQIKYFTAKRLASDAATWKAILKKAEKERANLFFGVCPRFGRKSYDRAFQIRVVRALWADLDYCAVEQALERCRKAGLPLPSIVLCSGHGCHLYWLLAEPYLIDDAGDPLPIKEEWIKGPDGESIKSASGKPCPPRKYVELAGEKVYEYYPDPKTGADNKKRRNPEFPNALSAKAMHVQHVLGGIAAKIEGDHTKDLARLLRLPGTLNRKDQRNGKEPVPCVLVECDPTRRYSFADFERFASHSPAKVKSDQLAKIRIPKRKLTQGRLDRLSDHINLCLTAEDRSRADYALCCHAVRNGLDKEEVWQQVAEVGKFAERGREYFDRTWSKADQKVRTSLYERLKQVGAKSAPGTNGTGAGGHASPPHDQPQPPTGRRLPEIQGNKRQLPAVTGDALEALRAANDPPTLFQRGNALTRLRTKADTGAPYLETLDENALRGLMARAATWTRVINTSKGEKEEAAPPPMDAVKDLMAIPGWDGIPIIDSVTECPVFGQDGALVGAPGYHPGARLWYAPAAGLDVLLVSDKPSQAEIDEARDLLLVDLIGDFPFKDEASKAHALAAVILPFVRRMIDGPTPLHLFDAPVEGTGKTLLVSCITIMASGREPEGFTESANDDEWRKRITAALEEGGTFMFIDNLNRILDTGALASVLTARTWKDRKLGFTKMLTLPNTAVWLASGNNTRLSRELIRRTVFCRLDAKVDAPWERKNFRHPNLLKWAKENREKLVRAALTLVRAWIAAGRPAGKQTLGMFESWVETVGGILDVAGLPGLLANAKEFRQNATDKVGEWRTFVAAWWQEHGDKMVGIAELFTLATEQKLLDSVLGDKKENSQRIRMGKAMGQAADRVFGEYRMERAGTDHKARQLYRLTQVQAQGEADESAADASANPPPPVEQGVDEEEVCEWSE